MNRLVLMIGIAAALVYVTATGHARATLVGNVSFIGKVPLVSGQTHGSHGTAMAGAIDSTSSSTAPKERTWKVGDTSGSNSSSQAFSGSGNGGPSLNSTIASASNGSGGSSGANNSNQSSVTTDQSGGDPPSAAVPEPGALPMLFGGLAGIAGLWRKFGARSAE